LAELPHAHHGVARVAQQEDAHELVKSHAHAAPPPPVPSKHPPPLKRKRNTQHAQVRTCAPTCKRLLHSTRQHQRTEEDTPGHRTVTLPFSQFSNTRFHSGPVPMMSTCLPSWEKCILCTARQPRSRAFTTRLGRLVPQSKKVMLGKRSGTLGWGWGWDRSGQGKSGYGLEGRGQGA
jgi:hypothetical protein